MGTCGVSQREGIRKDGFTGFELGLGDLGGGLRKQNLV